MLNTGYAQPMSNRFETDSAPKSVSPVENAFSQLEAAREDLAKLAQAVAQRLTPLRNQRPVAVDKDVASVAVGGSEFVGRILQTRDSIQATARVLMAVMDDLEC